MVDLRPATGDGGADRSFLFAIEANAVIRRLRTASRRQRQDHVDQLEAIHRTATQLEINFYVIRDCGRGGECSTCIPDGDKPSDRVVHLGPVADAWIPPAVAQAPMVINTPDCSRIS